MNNILMVKYGYIEVKMCNDNGRKDKLINAKESFGECQVILDIDLNTNYEIIANNNFL